MFDFVKNYFNLRRDKVNINSYKSWLYLGVLIQFIYSIYVLVIKHNIYKNINLSTVLIIFAFSIVQVLIIWIVNALIAFVIYKTVFRYKSIMLVMLLKKYIPYCITQNLYFILLTLILSMLATKSIFLIRVVEIALSVYTYFLFYKRHIVTK